MDLKPNLVDGGALKNDFFFPLQVRILLYDPFFFVQGPRGTLFFYYSQVQFHLTLHAGSIPLDTHSNLVSGNNKTGDYGRQYLLGKLLSVITMRGDNRPGREAAWSSGRPLYGTYPARCNVYISF